MGQYNPGIWHIQEGSFTLKTTLYQNDDIPSRPRGPIPVHYSCYELLSKMFNYNYESTMDLDVLYSALAQEVSPLRYYAWNKGVLSLDYYELNQLITQKSVKFRVGHGEDVSLFTSLF
jgi:hypothetical protein